MIEHINGKIIQKSLGYVVVDCNNIGYKLLVSNNTSYELILDEEQTIYTYLLVKEDSLTLIGFSTIQEREMFEILIGVSKVGAKTALAILSLYKTDNIVKFIKSKDIVSLSKVSGLGKKTAERLILELQDKVDIFINSTQIDKIEDIQEVSNSNMVAQESIEALSMLGFTVKEAQNAVKKALENNDNDNVQDIIRLSLSILKKQY